MVNMNVEFVICRCGDSQGRGRCLFFASFMYISLFFHSNSIQKVYICQLFLLQRILILKPVIQVMNTKCIENLLFGSSFSDPRGKSIT